MYNMRDVTCFLNIVASLIVGGQGILRKIFSRKSKIIVRNKHYVKGSKEYCVSRGQNKQSYARGYFLSKVSPDSWAFKLVQELHLVTQELPCI